MGRDSIALKGVHIVPGVVDNDYTGEINVAAAAPTGAISISAGERIAQLILLPLITNVGFTLPQDRSNKAFGATGETEMAFWVKDCGQCPMLTLNIEGKKNGRFA